MKNEINQIKFCDVAIGQKIRFEHNSIVYTRVNHLDVEGRQVSGLPEFLAQRTLTYVDAFGETSNAFCKLTSETLVILVED
jgi:hypothetical protein